MIPNQPIPAHQLFDRTMRKFFVGLSLLATLVCLAIALLASALIHREICKNAEQQFNSVSGALGRELVLGEDSVADELLQNMSRRIGSRSRVELMIHDGTLPNTNRWSCKSRIFSASFMAPVQIGAQTVGHIKGSVTAIPLTWLASLSLGVLFFFGLIFLWLRSAFLVTIQESILDPMVRLARGSPVADHKLLELRVIEEEMALQRSKILDQEKAVLMAEKAKSINKVARQLAHDIRSPLTALEIVTSKLDQVPEDVRLLMRTATQRVKDLSNNLLEMSRERFSGDENTLQGSSPQILASLVDQILSEKRSQFSTREGLAISGRIHANAYGLFARINQVEFLRVLSNLINNAAEAIQKDWKIELDLYVQDQRAIIDISDNGIGMPQMVLKNLGAGELSSGKRGIGVGHGLGLTHAFSVVRGAGGDIFIESALNVGTRIRISLPLTTPPDWFVPAINTSGVKVIVVDDDPSVHEVWENRFRETNIGNSLLHFFSLEDLEAFLKTSDSKPLILIDHEFNGHKATGLDFIKGHLSQADWVLVTSHFDCVIRTECLKAGIKLLPKSLAAQVPITDSP